MRGTLYTVVAPSGAGKTSLVQALVGSFPNIKVSISHTTRAKRPGEIDGNDYFFISVTEFQSMVKKHIFLEHAAVYGNFYGTSGLWVEAQLAAGIDVILEIDWQGTRQVKTRQLESIGIFILPPSREVLKQRLIERAQDSLTVIERRMEQASGEISHYREYDYLLINDDFDQTLFELKSIMCSHRLLQKRQAERYKELIADLLS